MRKKELILGIICAAILAAFGLTATIYYINHDIDILNAEAEATNVIPDTAISETAFEPIETQLDEPIIFEPIEIPDTSETAPKTDVQTAETEENISKCNFVLPNSNDDLILLARIVENEAGSNWCTDEHQKAVASVVINRVNDTRFPDTIYGVISQGWYGECPVQYAVGSPERFFSIEPSERALANAQYVLEHGSTVGAAIWQAEFIQGEIVAQFAYPEIYSTVTYICE